MVVSIVMIASILIRSNTEIKNFESIAEIVNNTAAVNNTDLPETDPVVSDSVDLSVDTEPEPTPIFKRNLEPIFEMNADCIGWICIPNTTVDYPVMYTPNEHQKYLRKNFEGKYSVSGTPFIQENCDLDSDNVIIYGHNMKNGTMFSDITAYVDPSYREQHPVIEFETSRGLIGYEVISVMQVNKNDPWYAFINATDEADYLSRVSAAMNASQYPIESEITYGRRLLTLSTCYGKSNDDRLIVIAAEQN
ncbi:MAG: class B sortase [Clostridia bacterium]|nr:class B sortase [Clostridia bacterium]